MSFLPIILILLYMMRKNPNLYNLLSSIDLESISPILELFNVDKKIVEELTSTNFQNFISGNGSFKDILPLLPILFKYFNKNTPANSDLPSINYPTLNEELNPIKDIASEKILSTLGNYFSV